MATDNTPMINILGFNTTYEMLPKRGDDPLNDHVDAKGYLLDTNNRRIMERQAEDWVTYSPAYSPLNTRITERVRLLVPDPERYNNDTEGERLAFATARWEAIKGAYAAWKSGQEIPINGTPLAVWPGLNQAQIEIMRPLGIRSVEDVMNLTDGQLDKVKLPGMREIRNQAKLFLEHMSLSASAEREAEKDRTIEAMQAQMEELRSLISQQNLSTNETDEVKTLRAELEAKGINYDKRWAAPKLRAALTEAEAA